MHRDGTRNDNSKSQTAYKHY